MTSINNPRNRHCQAAAPQLPWVPYAISFGVATGGVTISR